MQKEKRKEAAHVIIRRRGWIIELKERKEGESRMEERKREGKMLDREGGIKIVFLSCALWKMDI